MQCEEDQLLMTRRDTKKCPPLPLALLLLITSFCTVEDKNVFPSLTMVEKEIYKATDSKRQKRKLAMNRLSLSMSPFYIKKPDTMTSLSLYERQHPGVSGDAIVCAMAETFACGVFINLDVLNLSDNQISDISCTAMGDAFDRGALPRLEELHLGSNRIGGNGIEALVKAHGSGALSNLKELSLSKTPSIDEYA